ncbi:tRNA methyltransferase, has a role in tRNA modification [Coemansia javaensis]|uniref:tRNA methyltransferase, has a role in tRNA modification n=1 Tax=Coemansia javaensis TaxID=2761396 RepID=A0A9W8H5S2_9FUNG|nr:tRNA methyltransferase, has a role in tRNA modification [Coemansia javaensis]
MKREPVPDTAALDPAAKEAQFVHRVYAEIAQHFSETRHSGWPFVDGFLQRQAAGSVGLDIGCGNGKYLGANRAVHMIGVDYSRELVAICAERGFDCAVGDGLRLPVRAGAFDFAICIAVVHHYASEDRRVRALREALRAVRPGGALLVYAWAQEQQGRRRFDAATQDHLVPWETRAGAVHQRYYHLFRKGELERLLAQAGGCRVAESGYERDNWYVVATKTALP